MILGDDPEKKIFGVGRCDKLVLSSHYIQYNFRYPAVLEKFTGLTRGNPGSPGVLPSPGLSPGF